MTTSPTCRLFLCSSPHHRPLHSFPTRRSSDLPAVNQHVEQVYRSKLRISDITEQFPDRSIQLKNYINLKSERDRKSTRLNSSHVAISYAVFCLKKKKAFYQTSI